MRVGTAALEAAGAGGKGGERGEAETTGPRAEKFNLAESDRPGVSLVADILKVSEEEGEGAGRRVVAGGQRQPAAQKVPPASMKSILPAMQRKEEGKGGQGWPGTGVTGHGGAGGHTEGVGRQGTGGKGQGGASGARRTAEYQGGAGGKGGGQGHQWPRPQQLFRQQPPGSLPQVSAAVRAEEEREARRRQTGRYKALANLEPQRRRRQAPSTEPKTTYQLKMEVGRGGAEKKGKKEGAGGRRGGQPSGEPQGEEGKAGRSGPGTRRGGSGGHPEGQATGGGEGRQRGGTVRRRGATASGKEDRGAGGTKE